MDKLGFLDEPEGSNEEVQPVETPAEAAPAPAEQLTEEPTQEAVQPEAGDQPRDDKGRFASKQPEAKAEPQQQPPPGFVPVGAVQALRDEIRTLKAQHQAKQAPDFYEDQEGFIDQRVMQPIDHKLTTLNLNWSRRFAEQAYGADAVNEAEAWVMMQSQVDPMVGQRVISSPDPYGTAVHEFKQHQVLSKLNDPSRIDKFLAWEAAQAAAQAGQDQQPAAQAASPQQSAPTPTRSLATAPSSGGAAHVPTGPGQAFDSLFTR